MNFWQNLKKPIMVLAPMADVTDPVFRRIIAKYGKPDAMWTEFVSADGLFLGGYEHLIKDLAFTEAERPIIAQFFTSKPEMMEKAAELAVELGFNGIDINMGCPDKSIEKQGSGAAHIKNYKQAQKIVLAAKRGAQKNGKNLPVSIKTRIGYNKNELETWLPALLETEPAVITIHARTRKEMSRVPAHWNLVTRAVEIRDQFRNLNGKMSEVLIFGNGDVKDLAEAKQRVIETGCDGIMLGRAIFGNPFLFNKEMSKPFDIRKRLEVMVEHTKLFEELLPHKSFAIMKKHYKAYVTRATDYSQFSSNGPKSGVYDLPSAKELRMKLMEAENADEVGKIVESYLNNDSK